MQNIKIYSKDKQRTLFQGEYKDFKTCLEKAVEKGVFLNNADLRNKNLSNANLDDARMPLADFSNANLSGANLSESNLNGAKFDNASLYNACLAYSNLKECHFKDTAFGATDITGCDISNSHFSGLSAFSLDFTHTKSMRKCRFHNPCGHTSIFSNPPIVIKGLSPSIIAIMDRDTKIGHEINPAQNWIGLLKTEKTA